MNQNNRLKEMEMLTPSRSQKTAPEDVLARVVPESVDDLFHCWFYIQTLHVLRTPKITDHFRRFAVQYVKEVSALQEYLSRYLTRRLQDIAKQKHQSDYFASGLGKTVDKVVHEKLHNALAILISSK